MAKIGQQKKVPFGDFSLSPLKPPKIKPPFDLGNEEKGGFKCYHWSVLNDNSTVFLSYW